MKLKTFTQKTLALTLTALLAVSGLAFADNLSAPASSPAEDKSGTPSYTISPEQPLYGEYVSGAVTAVGEDRVTIKNPNEQATNPEIILLIGEQTLVLDAASGNPADFTGIKEGDYLYAYTSPIMTMSLPPQSVAEVILVNTPADMAAPTYAEIENVTVAENGNIILTTNRDVILTITDKTTLSPYLTKNIILKEMLKPGDRVLAWYSIVAESFPAQATPEKVMVLPNNYSGTIESDGLSLKANGETLRLNRNETLFVQENKLMIPLRKAAEALGFEVSWNEAARSITVTAGGQDTFHFWPNSTDAQQDDMIFSLQQPITVKFGVSFIAIDDFANLLNIKLVR